MRQECNIFQRVLHLHGNWDNLIYYESDPLLFGVVYNYTYLANNFKINVSRYFELILWEVTKHTFPNALLLWYQSCCKALKLFSFKIDTVDTVSQCHSVTVSQCHSVTHRSIFWRIFDLFRFCGSIKLLRQKIHNWPTSLTRFISFTRFVVFFLSQTSLLSCLWSKYKWIAFEAAPPLKKPCTGGLVMS